jgi:hypothetical protein
MAQWKKTDTANGVPIWSPNLVKLTANVANKEAMFGNTTADSFITGQTIGVFAVDANESRALGSRGLHTGWVKRTVGSGGRANRIQYETLVAGGISSDSENSVFTNYSITINTQPLANSVATGAPATFRVVATTVPEGATLAYQWQFANGDNIAANAIYTNVTTANLVITDATGLDGISFKVLVSNAEASSVTSSNALLTVT